MLNVFLSGKIDPRLGEWRDFLIATDYDYKTRRQLQSWRLRPKQPELMYERESAPPAWPTTPNNWVLGIHNYVGPYRIDPEGLDGILDADPEHWGTFHGTVWTGQHGMIDDGMAHHIVASCCAALRRADIVFAYINSPDCFGTLVEIGFAHALGKFVYVVVQEGVEWEYRDYWFAQELTEQGRQASRWHYIDVGDKGDEPNWIRGQFREALVQYTAEPPRPRPTELVRGARNELSESFANIAKWTSDPRVRGEANRMLKRLSGQSA